MTDVSPDLARALDRLPVIPKGAKLLGDDYTDFVSKVLDAHRAGASIRQISERTERGYGSIQRLIHAEAPDAAGLQDEQCAIPLSAELARALDRLPVIPKDAKLKGDKYTDFVSKVLDAHRAGASIRQISERTERGYGSIQRLIRAEAPESVRGRGGDNRRATRWRRSSTTTVARYANGDRPAEQPGQHLADGLRTSARRLPALSSAPARMGAFLTAVRAHRADSDLDVREGHVPLTGDGGNHFFSRP